MTEVDLVNARNANPGFFQDANKNNLDSYLKKTDGVQQIQGSYDAKKYKMMESVGAPIKWRRRPSSASAPIPSRKKIIYTEKALVNLRAERGNTQYQTQQQHIQGSYDA
ncbi:MAG: hypothetical protein FWH52_05795, partial [Synergistaceae bacterium]|nr:hypothetical protein [Synergistaceae bacterium]